MACTDQRRPASASIGVSVMNSVCCSPLTLIPALTPASAVLIANRASRSAAAAPRTRVIGVMVSVQRSLTLPDPTRSTSSVWPGWMTMNRSGSVWSSESIRRRTLSSSTISPQTGIASSRVTMSSRISCCMLMGMSGHHVEGDQVAVVAGNIIDMPDLAAHDRYRAACITAKATLSIQMGNQCLAHSNRHQALDGAKLGQALHTLIDDGLQPLRQRRTAGREVVNPAVAQRLHEHAVHVVYEVSEAGHGQTVSSMTDSGLVHRCSGLDCASPRMPLSKGMRSSLA